MRKLQFIFPFFLILAARLALAQVVTTHDGELSLAFAHSRAEQTSTWFVDYVEHSGEPAFRIFVHHFHADCSGYLYIGLTKISYDPVFTPAQKDSFEVPRGELKSATPRYSGFSLTLGGKVQQFAFLSEPTRHPVAEGDAREQLMLFASLMVNNFELAQTEFGRIAAGWQQMFLPRAAPNQATGAAGIKVFSPSGAEAGKVIDATNDPLAVIGLVAEPTPVRGVVVNGQPIPIRSITPNVVEFRSFPLRLQSPTTSINLVSIFDSGQAQLIFIVRKPRIDFAPGTLRTSDPAATVKGTIFGYGEIERVELDGKAASLTRNADNSVGFETPSVPVKLGKNTLLGTIVDVDGSEHPFSVVVERQFRLSLEFVERAIHTLSRERLLDLLNEYGVNFELDAETEKQLRAAGADKSLLEAIGEAGP